MEFPIETMMLTVLTIFVFELLVILIMIRINNIEKCTQRKLRVQHKLLMSKV